MISIVLLVNIYIYIYILFCSHGLDRHDSFFSTKILNTEKISQEDLNIEFDDSLVDPVFLVFLNFF
jgi:hypothetical protein